MFFEIISIGFNVDASDENRTTSERYNLELELNNEFRGLLIEAPDSDSVPELVETMAGFPIATIMVKPVHPFLKLNTH
ncbi:MAG: hypothetical protein EBU08_13140 [Micrococcales bacterium]|nr:hypothetical protein [Micrococcales bacterium]